ncbi:MAG: ABC transporter ATP-binding protein, partial [Bacteroidales bacterium]|nr:ABC transporter ATP-binding protein [Bacteroidales bacterium]
KVYEFGGGKVIEHLGGIQYFLEKKKMDNLQEIEKQALTSKQENTDKSPSENKLSYEARKEFNKLVKRLEKQVEQCESRIESLEKQVAQTEEKLMTAEGSTNLALHQIHGKVKKELNDSLELWEAATLELENLRSKSE